MADDGALRYAPSAMFNLRSASLPRRLLLLALAGLLPVVLFGATALVLLARQQGNDIERATIRTTRAMTGAIDGELSRAIAVLQTLATAGSLEQDNPARFRDAARRVLQQQPAWTTISLTDPAGRQRISAVQRPRLPLTGLVGHKEGFERVVRDRRPAIGPVMLDPLLNTHVFTVHVPVVQGAKLRYVLTAAIEPRSMLDVIARQKVPVDGLVTVFDQQGDVVARSRGHNSFVGRPVSPTFATLMTNAGEGWGRSFTLEGEPVYSAFGRSDVSRWGVGIGIPAESIEGPMRRSYLFLAAGILFSLALGGAGAMLVARRIAGPIQALRAAALAVGRGERPAAVSTAIPEVRDVAEALAGAAEDRERAERAREATLRLEREARAFAEEANRTKDQFLAMLGHELRNPLAAIASATQLLMQPTARPEVRQRAETVLKRQVEHLTRLVDDLLDVERAVTGKIALERAPLDLAEVLAQSLAALRATGRLDPYDVDVRAETVWIEGDATRIDQIVTNLLINAAKFTPAGRQITLTLAREGGDAVLRVRDQGIGIDAELLPKVFDLFVQGERPLDRAQGGFGVGLTLVRRLVELHGGAVTAESEGVGAGSVFTVRLPALQTQSAYRATEPDPGLSIPAAFRRILLVEDNDDVRVLMRAALEASGHTVHEAADGPGGVDAAVGLRPDVALIDLGLPGIDGYEVARRIRAALGPGIRLVALTGYGLPDDRRRSYEAGFDAHLVKPVDVGGLERALAGAYPVSTSERRSRRPTLQQE